MKTIQQLLNEKGNEIWSTTPGSSVLDALSLMAEKGVGALVVLEGDKLAGILSERDYARKVILKQRASKDTPVRDIMSANVYCVNPEQQVDQCLSLMTEKRVRHLPVMKEGKLLGMVSIGDLVKSIIAEQKVIIAELEQYIKS